MSSGDYEKAQKLSIERGRLYSDVTENPLGDLAQLLGDMAGTGVSKGPTGQDLPDSIPRGEELHQNRLRIGQVDDQLRQLRDKYDIPPYLYPDSSGSDSKGAQGQFEWKTLSPDKILSNDVLSPLGVGSSTGPVSGAPPSGPDDPGGIDFRSVRLVYLSEAELSKPGSWDMRKFSSGLQAIRSNGSIRLSFHDATRLAQTAFYTFLSLPDRDFWVNLHPGEPDRIISQSLGQTDVGRIMLLADYQLKKDAGKLMRQEPFASRERALAKSIARRHTGSNSVSMRWGSTGRVEISSGTGRVFARQSKTGIFIEGVILDVVFEQKAFRVSTETGGAWEAIELTPDEWKQFVRLTQVYIRPLLIKQVNQAPEYEDLRQAFSARVLADWYKRNLGAGGSLSTLIDTSQLTGLRSAIAWSPARIWETYKRDYESGSSHGFGGVNLTKMPQFRPMNVKTVPGAFLLAQAMRSPRGLWRAGVYRTGGMFVAIKEPSFLAMACRWIIVLLLLALAGQLVLGEVKRRGLSIRIARGWWGQGA